jgi:hypothetical protein
MGLPGMKVLETATPATALNADTYKIKCLICSEGSGDGKTTAGCTIFGKKLLIDLDNRSESVADWPNIEIIKIFEPDVKNPKAWDKLVKLKEELWKATEMDIYPYDSIIVDGLTELFRLCMYWVQHMDGKKESFGIAGSPGEQHWGPQMKHVADWIRSMIGLPTHLVVTSHEEIKEFRKTGETKYGPMSTGKLIVEIPKWFNETYYNLRIREKEGPVKFFWYTQAFKRHNYLKSSLNCMQKYWNDPIPLDFSDEVVGFPALWQKRFEVPEPTLPNREEVKKEA